VRRRRWRRRRGRARFFARSFVVFNRDQVDGAEARRPKSRPWQPVADALAFLEGVGVPVEYGFDAYYRRTSTFHARARLSTMTSIWCPRSHMSSRTRVDMWG
jgi:antirestriction protein ArdC